VAERTTHALTKAQQTGIEPELQEMLLALHLEQYAPSFAEQGYDELADVHGMGMEELVGDVCMKKGHARRLMRHFNQNLA
jgi:hypothetical protein